MYFIFQSGQVRSDFGLEIGPILKRSTFSLRPRFFETFQPFRAKIYPLSSIIKIKLFLSWSIKYSKKLEKGWDIFTRDRRKTTKSFPFLSRVSRGKGDSEKVKLDPGARFLSASFPFYRESKLPYLQRYIRISIRHSPLLPCRPINNYSFLLTPCLTIFNPSFARYEINCTHSKLSKKYGGPDTHGFKYQFVATYIFGSSMIGHQR